MQVMGVMRRLFNRWRRQAARHVELEPGSLRDVSSKISWRPSEQELADLRLEATDPKRRDEFSHAAHLSPLASPAEGLEQLWDLLDLLTTLAGPLPPDRTITKTHFRLL